MTQIKAHRLTKYQASVLQETASAEVPIFIMPRPHVNDSARQKQLLEGRFKQLNALVGMGFMVDSTAEFAKYLSAQTKRTGRRFKVFGMSELGYLMFKNGAPTTVN